MIKNYGGKIENLNPGSDHMPAPDKGFAILNSGIECIRWSVRHDVKISHRVTYSESLNLYMWPDKFKVTYSTQ